MIRNRWVRAAVWSIAALLVLAAVALLTVRSPWFYNKVRETLVSRLEEATGGKVEIARFRFDWTRLRAEVEGLTLHGTEPAGAPPLLRCQSAIVGLKIVSIFKRDIDIQYLGVNTPRVYLTIGPDGRTNVPEPKIKTESNAIETALKLAIGRLDLAHGVFEVAGRGATPFDLHGENLAAALQYQPLVPEYHGTISVQQIDLAGRGSLAVAASVSLRQNRIGVDRLNLVAGQSQVTASGAVDDLAAGRGAFQYEARVSNSDAERFLKTKLLDRGTAESKGGVVWRGGTDFDLNGSLHAYGLDYRDSHVRLRNFQADGSLHATSAAVEAREVRLSGRYIAPGGDLPVSGRVGKATLHGRDLALQGIALAALDGTFRGDGTLRDLKRYDVRGEIAGFAARRVLALYSKETLPWDALATSALHVQGVLGAPKELLVETALEIAPAPGSAPVRGELRATYEARSGTLDLGRSTVSLPSSTVSATGAIGHELRVHVETRDLHDLLPLLGKNENALPVKLDSKAVFDGTVNGGLDDPTISGRLTAGRFSFQDRTFDNAQADLVASPQNIRATRASVGRNGWSAQFQMAVGLQEWAAEDNGQIFGSVTVANAPAEDIAMLAGASLPVTGTANAVLQIAGTVGNPLVKGEVRVQRGSYAGEPFDSATANLSYANRTAEMSNAQIEASGKQVQASAVYVHQSGDFAKGRLRFQISTNAMPLEQMSRIQQERPGLKGAVRLSAQGVFDVPFRVDDLNADVTATGLQLTGQALGSLHLTARSQGPVLSAHVDSNFAASEIRGDGQWRLEGDYPGEATVTFSKVDFAQLRSWVLPADSPVASDLAGSAVGTLHITGPALKPEAIRADLRIPQVEASFAPAGLVLHNSGPIVVTYANSTATIQSARLTGRNTDLSLTGKIATQGKGALDLHVAGRVDLDIVHDWNRDFSATGVLDADGTVRGTPASPQIAGRVQFERASFNIADVPNGISNATGVIVFSGSRASIQSFTGETGGGKIRLFGFAAYGGGPTVFRVHAQVEQVRVRYPEGVSTVANASLNLTGTTDRSMVAGTITVLRTTFNPQADFSSVIARSAEPVRSPAARTGFLGGLNFDVNIETSPDVQVQSALTQDVQLEANLHLRGTVAAPALLGRINITQGQIVFFGTRYRIGQGSISFFNPLAVEPVLDVDLETKARGIEVTLTVSGPLNKLNLSYRSDPPLQFSEIVALLATGRTPTSDAALMSSQNPAAQSFQQMGASALLGQAISSPVTGRLQRFFGVSRLRIDPTLPGVEYNPQARLTLEQQVTQDITFTYITDVTSTNPQVVSVEWAFAKQWSVVAQRDENGMIGMDIFFKKRF